MTLYRILNFCAYEVGRFFFSERIGDIIIVDVGVVPPTCGKLGDIAESARHRFRAAALMAPERGVHGSCCLGDRTSSGGAMSPSVDENKLQVERWAPCNVGLSNSS